MKRTEPLGTAVNKGTLLAATDPQQAVPSPPPFLTTGEGSNEGEGKGSLTESPRQTKGRQAGAFSFTWWDLQQASYAVFNPGSQARPEENLTGVRLSS